MAKKFGFGLVIPAVVSLMLGACILCADLRQGLGFMKICCKSNIISSLGNITTTNSNILDWH